MAFSDQVHIASDDGTAGETGMDFLNELLKSERFDRCVVMGPVVMMKDVSEITKPLRHPDRRDLDTDHDRRHGHVRCLPCDRGRTR